MRYNELIHLLQNLTKSQVSQTKIAEALNYSVQKINKRAIRNSNFNEKEIKILENFFNINMSKKSTQNDDYVEIPVKGNINSSFAGISTNNEISIPTYSISSKLAEDIGINISSSEIIFAKGDSMLPTIEAGDSLLIDLTQKEVYDGAIYCVRLEGQLYPKRLQKIPPKKIKIISDNKEKYDPVYIDFSSKINFDFEIIGEIKWWGRIAK